jgi:ankyrin repeat protein
LFDVELELFENLSPFYFQENKTALHWSAINGHKDICSLLLEAHADVNALDNVSCKKEVELIKSS